jgi:dTDP-4-dehydrorhamnose reductase
VEADARGTFHACGEGDASRWDLARAALDAAGLSAVPVERIATADLSGSAGLPRPAYPTARRPARAVLSTAKLLRTLGFRLPPWRDSLTTYVNPPQL